MSSGSRAHRGNLNAMREHYLVVRTMQRGLVCGVLVTACSSAAPEPVAPVSAQSPIDAAPMLVAEPDRDDGVHVLPLPPEKRGRVVVTTSDACGLVIQPVWFAQGSETPISSDPIDGIADMLTCEHKDSGLLLKIAIQGHADASETDPDELSRRRAQTVATMLVARKMPNLGFVIEPLGTLEPRDTTGTADGRARNRRVDFLVLERKTKED